MEHVDLTGAGNFALGLGVLVGAIVQLLNWFTNRNNADKISELTAHTNGIKDALVLVTGQSEHAKGMLAGRQAAIDNGSIKGA